MSKSKLFGIGVKNYELELFDRCVNCSIGSLPFTYLGLQVGASMARAVNWNPLVENFCAKLSKWKSSTLSSGGRLTLCKAVLVWKRSECVSSGAGMRNNRKTAWIAWDKALAPRDSGKLDIW
uniref:Reverse transcriptase zinc-binding domain-containing protein n=1 Tax=Lactuca sativa TaxID=4236 RepID=A0A9R1WMW4_LACSA|nr:hypothetical protein LSAT_V11C100023870 [Lactuca sativa]